LPDFRSDEPSGIDFIHRSTPFGEIYFLRNEREESVTSRCRFRVTQMHPEIWDPSTGAISRVAEYSDNEGQTSLELKLPAHGSVFVFFSRKYRSDLSVFSDPTPDAAAAEIAGPWKVDFPPGWGAPPSTEFERLISWTDSDNTGIKYFSGTATYHNSFQLEETSADKQVVIDLGEIRDVAEVFVNGKTAGILWKKPYRANISAFVQPGKNELKIEIVNLWVNRLTGDMLADPKDRFCQTNQSFMTNEVWPGGDEPFRLQPAGLLGPVRVSVEKE
jgi:hypothetical protein